MPCLVSWLTAVAKLVTRNTNSQVRSGLIVVGCETVAYCPSWPDRLSAVAESDKTAMKLNRLRYLAQVSLLLIVTLACAIGVQAQSGGTKWSAPTDLGQSSNTDYGAWGVILCDQYQNAHIVWSDMARNGAALFYSTDAEGSWSLPADVIMQPGQGILRTAAAISNKTDTLHVAWVDDEMGSNVYHSKSPLQTTRNAHSWSTPVLLSSQHPGEVSMTIDQAGVLHVIYPAYLDGYQLGLYLHSIRRRRHDIGSDPVTVYITTAPVLSGISLRSAIDAAGRLHVGVAIRSAKYGIYSEVGYLRSPDGGRTWTPYRQLFASKLNPTGGTRGSPPTLQLWRLLLLARMEFI